MAPRENIGPAPVIDRMFHAWLARLTLGLSPAALMQAYLDWLVHLTISPGKQAELAQKALRKAIRFTLYAAKEAHKPNSTCCIEPLPQDNRFRDPAWRAWPFNLIYQSFLLMQQWWYNATTGIKGVSRQHENVMEFMARQVLDVVSPSSFVLTNPVVLQTTVNQVGVNLVRGWFNFIEDWERAISGKGPAEKEAFEVDKNIAVTPGKVVFRNRRLSPCWRLRPTSKKQMS